MWSILANIGYLILVLNLILFLKGVRNNSKAYKIFTWYLGVIFVVQIVSVTLMKNHINNLFLSHFYFIGQFIVLSLFYINILKEKFQKKVVKFGLFLGLIALGIQYAVHVSLFLKFNLFEIHANVCHFLKYQTKLYFHSLP
jgi:hypothetical protein